jgi:hypothetical protein
MARNVPPFGGYADPGFARCIAWIMSFVDPADWKQRAARIEQTLRTVFAAKQSEIEAGTTHSISFPADTVAWYLYLADKALHDPHNYEPNQGARIVPIFNRLGADLDLLKSIRGVEGRIRRMLTSDRRQPDSILFELLAALLWRRNGYDPVEFIPEVSAARTPDFCATRGSSKWFIECKRLQKSSDYSERERTKWLTLWAHLKAFLIAERQAVVFDIVFHAELENLPDTLLLDELPGKLRLVSPPCRLIDNEIWTVDVKAVDFAAARDHLKQYYVRYPSTQANELIGGRRDPNRGFTALALGTFVQAGEGFGLNTFLDELAYGAGAFWSCDAPRAIERKARDIRGRLAEAVRQLPDNGQCVIHVGMETLEGIAVEMERILRIVGSVASFDSEGKDLKWIYCHQFQSYAPPDEAWVIDETVHDFGRANSERLQPLACQSMIVPESHAQEGVHWLRPAP